MSANTNGSNGNGKAALYVTLPLSFVLLLLQWGIFNRIDLLAEGQLSMERRLSYIEGKLSKE